MRKTGQPYVLCFLDDDYGRDVEIVMPLIFYAEKYLNCYIEFVFVWEIHAIYLRKPDLVLIPNAIGSKWYFEIAKYAHENGIKVFALISEGNFRTDGSFDHWGFNVDKKLYQEYLCCWSDRTRDYMKQVFPDFSDRIVTTGATGFDRYLIYKFKDKKTYLDEKGISRFNKVIGYAGWAFGKLTNTGGRKELRVKENPNPRRFQWMMDKMYEIEAILKETIENNPDTLFILKRHPNEIHPHITSEGQNEMIRLSAYPNVLYIRDKENLHDIINVSDIWLAFRSTTVLEAWLLKPIPTLLLSPDLNYNPDPVFKGCPIVDTASHLQELIKEYYKTGNISEFDREEISKNREGLIHDTIGFGDGLNHLRTGYYFKKLVDSIEESKLVRVAFNFRHLLKYFLLHSGKYFYFRRLFLKLPKFRKTVWIFDRHRLRKLPELKEKYFAYLDDFYTRNKLDSKINTVSFWNEMFRND